MDRKEQKEKEALSVEEANLIIDTLSTGGWKVIESFINKIADPNRLKVSPVGLAEYDFKSSLYISGQIEGIDKLKRLIHAALKQRSKIIKRNSGEGQPPDLS